MTTIFIILILLLISYIFFTLGRIYEINCNILELEEDNAGCEAEIEATYRYIIKRLEEEEGVQG